MFRVIFTIALSLVLISCGGGSSGDKPNQRPAANLKGQASQALIRNASVKIYPFGQTHSTPVYVTSTNSIGEIVLDNGEGPRLESGVYEAVLTGGSYTEEMTGTDVSLIGGTHWLKSSFIHEVGDEIDIVITPESTIATELAHCYFDAGVEQNFESAVISAFIEVGQLFGYNPKDTYVTDLTDIESFGGEVNNPSVRSGLVHAGRSALAVMINEENGREGHDLFSSQDLTQKYFTDVRYDCLLDGKTIDENGATIDLYLGSYQITAGTYRDQLAIGMLMFINSQKNLSGFNSQDILHLAEGIASYNGSTFNQSPVVIDAGAPVLSTPVLNNQIIAGVFEYEINTEAFAGVDHIEIYIDDILIDDLSGDDNSFTINASLFDQGEHVVKAVAFDFLGTAAELKRTIVIDNQGAATTFTSDSITNQFNYLLTGVASDTYSDVISVKVGNEQATLDTNGEWQIEVELIPGVNLITVSMLDDQYNQTEQTYTVSLDVDAPLISAQFSNGPVWNGSEVVTQNLEYLSISEGLYVSLANSSIGITKVDEDSLSIANVPYLSVGFTDEGEIFTPTESLSLSYQVFDRDSQITPKISFGSDNGVYLIPLTKEYLSNLYLNVDTLDQLVINIEVQDLAGNSSTLSKSIPLYVDLPKIDIYTPFQNSSISIEEYSGSIGAKFGECSADLDGACNAAVATYEESFVVTADDLEYVEPFNETLIESELTIPGYIAFSENVNDQLILYPLAAAFSGLMECKYKEIPSWSVAYAFAETTMNNQFGFNPLKVIPADLDLVDSHTPATAHALANLVLSTQVYDQYGEFTDQYNSISLAVEMYKDGLDCELNGLDNGSPLNSFVDLTANYYSNKFPVDMIRVARSENHASVDALVEWATNQQGGLIPGPSFNVYSESLVANPNIWIDYEVTDPNGLYKMTFGGTTLIAYDAMSGSVAHTIPNADGTHVIAVTATNHLGITTNGTLEVELDTTGPSVLLIYPEFTNNLVVNVEATATDLHGIDRAAFNGETVSLPGSVSLPLTGGDGKKVFTFEVWDSLDNPTVEVGSITLDTISPTASMSAIEVTNQDSVDVTVTASDSSGISLVSVAGNTKDTGDLSSTSFNIPLNSSGNNSIAGTVQDRASNSTIMSPITVYRDTTNPSLELIVQPYTNSTSVTVSSAASDDYGIAQVVINGIKTNDENESDIVLTSGDGTKTVSGTAFDIAGNSTNAMTTTILDTVAPTGVLTAELLTNQSATSVTLTSSDLSGIARVEIEDAVFNTGDLTSVSKSVALREGLNTVEASITDVAGNSFVVPEISIRRDTTKPTGTILVPTSITNQGFIDVTVRSTDAYGLGSVTIDGVTYDSGDLTAIVHRVNLEPGNNSISGSATDLAGNTQAFDTVTVLRDITKPTLNITVPSYTNNRDIEVTVSASDSNGIDRVVVNGEPAEPEEKITVTIPSGDGSKTVTAVAYDTAGNSTTVTKTIVLDTVKPTWSLVTNDMVKDDNYVIEITASDAVALGTVSIDGNEIALVDGRFYTNLRLTKGFNEFSVDVYDLAGNKASNSEVVIQKDNYRPNLDIGGSLIEFVNGSGTIGLSSCESNAKPVILEYSELNGTDSPYYSIRSEDVSSFDTAKHDASELTNSFRVLKNDVVVVNWRDLDMQVAGNDALSYIYISKPFLGDWLASVSPTDNIRIEFKSSDPLGNYQVRGQTCQWAIQPDNQTLTNTTNKSFTFANIPSAGTPEVASYEYINNTAYPVWVLLSDVSPQYTTQVEADDVYKTHIGNWQKRQRFYGLRYDEDSEGVRFMDAGENVIYIARHRYDLWDYLKRASNNACEQSDWSVNNVTGSYNCTKDNMYRYGGSGFWVLSNASLTYDRHEIPGAEYNWSNTGSQLDLRADSKDYPTPVGDQILWTSQEDLIAISYRFLDGSLRDSVYITVGNGILESEFSNGSRTGDDEQIHSTGFLTGRYQGEQLPDSKLVIRTEYQFDGTVTNHSEPKDFSVSHTFDSFLVKVDGNVVNPQDGYYFIPAGKKAIVSKRMKVTSWSKGEECGFGYGQSGGAYCDSRRTLKVSEGIKATALNGNISYSYAPQLEPTITSVSPKTSTYNTYR